MQLKSIKVFLSVVEVSPSFQQFEGFHTQWSDLDTDCIGELTFLVLECEGWVRLCGKRMLLHLLLALEILGSEFCSPL